MTENTPPQDEGSSPEAAPPAPPSAPTPPPAPPTSGKTPRAISRRARAIAVAAAATVLLAGAGTAWYFLGDSDPMGHVDISGGKLADAEEDEDCDDDDEWEFNDCDDEDGTYRFVYKITNEGNGYANYRAVVNAFDDDGDFIGQTAVFATHVAAGETEADTDEFSKYEMEDRRRTSQIARVELAHVERVPLAN